MKQPIIVPSKKSGNLLYAFGSLVFVLIGIFYFTTLKEILMQNDPSMTYMMTPLMVLDILFFGFCFYILVKRMFTNQPILVVDEKGITDYSSWGALGFVPWEDIQFVHLQPHLNQTYISVTIKDNEKYLSQMNWWKTQAHKANLRMGFPLMNITLNTTGYDPQQVYFLILREYGSNFGVNH